VTLPLNQEERDERRRVAAKRRRHRRRRIVALVALVVLLAPVAYSYASYMTRPSSVPWKIRSVEYLRDHHMAWAVNTVENWWYGLHAPTKGGPGVSSLPSFASTASARPRVTGTGAPYRPPPVTSAAAAPLKNEGVWSAVGQSVAGVPAMLATSFRSEADYPGIVTYAVWIDATRTRLALYPGRYEPPAANPRGPMMIPVGQRQRALAAFNSGFKLKDGGGGMVVNGVVDSPMIAGRGTVVAYPNGTVDVISWPASTPPGTVVLARQNLPLIVVDGKPNPTLSATQRWGNTLNNAVRVWRTALGVDAHGNLVYVAADKQTAPSIAAALARAGAVRGVELDINAEWPTFNVYGRSGGGDPTKIVPNSQQPATRYLTPDDRDFFVVYAKRPGVAGNPGVPLN
jgi:hypothetical protein